MNKILKSAGPAQLVIYALRGYKKWISPMLGQVCRFYPSCSSYSIEVYHSYGFWKGTILTIRRLLKCHPFHPGGVDLPPRPDV